MSNIKKIIGIVLALVMVLSMASVAFAADDDAYTIKLVSDKKEIAPGETAKVEVQLTTNFYTSAIFIPVFFDNANVTVTASTEYKNSEGKDPIVTEDAVDASRYYNGTEYTKDDHGFRALAYTAAYGTALEKYNNKVVMTLEVTANEKAEETTVVLECLEASLKTPTKGGTLYISKNSSGNSTLDSLGVPVYNYTITDATATINIKAAGEEVGDPELVLTETGEDYGTIIRDDLCTTDYDGCVFGIPTLDGEEIEDYVTAENGSIEVLPNEDSDEYTTGATIILKNNAGEPVATYVFIYFGDVNGDGAVDISDAGDVEAHDMWLERIDEDTAAYYAADVNGDGEVDISDAGDIEAHDMWLARLDEQNVLAENFNAAW